MSRPASAATHSVAVAAVVLATAFAAWLRLHGLGAQVVQDDEWHALHKLVESGYGEIFRSFGYADHSIPLTLLYKWMASWAGLDEINLRALQAACGTALVPLAAALAWKASRAAAVAALLAWLVAGAPLLVLYSRLARPYAITTLLVVATLAALWRWRERRSWPLAAFVCAATALAAWLHPISSIFPAVAMLFVFGEDLRHRRQRAPSTVALAAGTALAMALPLAAPVASDLGSLSAKAGGHFAGFYTLWRAASLFLGGLPDGVTAAALAVAAYGAARFARTRPALGGYLLALAAVPVAVFAALGAQWTHQGHTFGRYVFPAQLVLLFWFSIGAIDLAERIARRASPAVGLGAALALAAGYVAFNPVVRQVTTLGAWYAHVYHQYDYVARHNAAAAQYAGYTPPEFYRRLGGMPPGAAPVIEAPFTFSAPANAFGFFATFHRQPERIGFLHDLCLDGARFGELPRDGRFRFRNFVPLDDPAAVRASGARYLLLFREQRHSRPFAEADRCIAALSRLYGEPAWVEPRLAVFDLRPAGEAAKLQ